MSKRIFLISTLFLFLTTTSCRTPNKDQNPSIKEIEGIVVGANQTDKYLELLKGKNIAVVANNTSIIFKNDKTNSNYQHLVDSLLSLGIHVTKVFAPEHGFRGVADAGEYLTDTIDGKTGLPIFS